MSDETAATTAPQKISDLKPKMKLQGTIKSIELFGAFVDVGLGHDGMIHISQLRRERTNKVEDAVQLGQQVTVWVRKVDTKNNRLDLTMVEPNLLDWDDLKPGIVVKGKVVKMERFGVFVDIGAERNAFIHVRELMNGYVSDPEEVVKAGQEVEAKVIGVDRRKRRIDMSIRALDDFTPEEAEPEVETATAMELALRQALKTTGEATVGAARAEKRRKKSKAVSASTELEAAYARTIKQHTSDN